jgi:hypothetical protein
MRPVNYKEHAITVHAQWDALGKCWSCDATVCVMEAGRRTSSTVFDTFRRHKIKARAVTAILNVTRQWIDEGKRDDIAEQ